MISEELILKIVSFTLTNRDDSSILIKLCCVSKMFNKIFSTDLYWKSSLAIKEMGQHSEVTLPTNNSCKDNFMILKRKELGIEYSISQYFGSYVTVNCFKQSFKTQLINKTISPKFNETFLISLKGMIPDDFFKEVLFIKVIDKLGDKVIGELNIFIRDLEYDEEEEFTNDIKEFKIKYKTKIYNSKPDLTKKKRRTGGIVDGIKFLDQIDDLILMITIIECINLPKSNKQIILENPQDYYYQKIEELKYEEEEGDDNIKFEQDGTVEYGTLNKLIEELTSPIRFDTHYCHTFMITFRSFTDRNILIEKLMERFNIPPPKNCSNEEFIKFKSEKLDKIRLRVASTIKYWIENFYLFDFDDEFKQKIEKIIQEMNQCKGGTIYSSAIQRALKKCQDDLNVIPNQLNCPPIETPKFTLFPKFHNKTLLWSSIEIARQITLIEFNIFKTIEPKECLNLAWSKGQRETKAPGITAMINRFNKLSRWVTISIVETKDMKERVEVIDKMIEIGDCLYQLNNFNGIFSIVSGLSMAPVFRLKKTWKDIKNQEIFDKLNKLMSRDGNFKAIRERIKNVKPPIIPYIGRYLTDLTFVEDGNPKFINGKINFVKCKCFAGVIRDMQLYQNQGYSFKESKELKSLLTEIKDLSDDQLYQLSITIEPKEVKKKPTQ